MIHLPPTASYGLISMLVLCLLLGAVTLPNATRWFQGSSASIQQDIIVLFGNDTTLKSSSAYGYKEWEYSKNLVAADNTPAPAESGLQGILYDRGLSCSSIVNNTLPLPIHESAWQVNMSRIALIQLGGCLLREKLEFAQGDGASAAIFYNSGSIPISSSLATPVLASGTSDTMNVDSSLDEDWQTKMHIEPGTIFIPAYHVDDATGQELYQRLANLTNWDTTRNLQQGGSDLDAALPPSHLVTRVTLYPDQQAFLEPWQFALIVVGVVVLTSLTIILAVQCHVCQAGRKRRQQRQQRRQQQQQQEGTDDTHYEDNDETDGPVNESFWLQLLSAATTEDDYSHAHQQSSQQEKKQRYRLHPSVLDTLPTRQWDGPDKDKADQCVICLEPFAVDDTLRTLPCDHEYHRDCIDVWLTKKNACCPLCLQLAITLPTMPEQAHHTSHHASASLYSHQQAHTLWCDLADQEETTTPYATALRTTLPLARTASSPAEVSSTPHETASPPSTTNTHDRSGY